GSRRPCSESRGRRARSCTRRCRSTIRRSVNRTSRGRSRSWGGSRRSSLRRGSDGCSRPSAGSPSVSRLRGAVPCVAAALLAAGVAAGTASASKHMLVGINDEANTLYGNPDVTFPILRRLHVQLLRVNLYWGGRFGVALERPQNATNPRDPAYAW